MRERLRGRDAVFDVVQAQVSQRDIEQTQPLRELGFRRAFRARDCRQALPDAGPHCQRLAAQAGAAAWQRDQRDLR